TNTPAVASEPIPNHSNMDNRDGDKAAATNEKAEWCHRSDEKPPKDYYGPLSGCRRDLATAICQHPKGKPYSDGRPLKTKARNGRVWIREMRGHEREVYFREEKAFEYAKERLTELREKKRNKPKRDEERRN